MIISLSKSYIWPINISIIGGGMEIVPLSFFERENVNAIARELIGKILLTNWDQQPTSGRIVETEAYAGETDRASHAFKGRTSRTAVMFDEPGRAYVYLCYGIHEMFNIVTGPVGTAHAVLIRALEPLTGIDTMLARTGKPALDHSLTRGPGNVGKAMGFHRTQTGTPLTEDIQILDDGYRPDPRQIGVSPRIGVAYAKEHALLPYRYYIRGNPFVSGKPAT